MCTLAIIGGSQETSFKKAAKKQGITILFHDGKMSKHRAKYQAMIRSCDVVVIVIDAISHKSMNAARDIASDMDKTIVFQKGRGVTGAISLGLAAYLKIQKEKLIVKKGAI